MKKKILSIALALCMVLTMMPMATGVAWAAATSVTVGGKTLSSTGNRCYHNGGTTDNIEAGANAIFDAANGKLTLNGLTLTSGSEHLIHADGDLTIVLVGDNTLGDYTNFGKCAIEVENGNLTISGSGKLNAYNNETSALTTIHASGSMRIDGAKVTAIKAGGGAQAINAQGGDIVITNSANVTATNNGDDSRSHALLAGDIQGVGSLKNIEVTNGATLTATQGGSGETKAVKGTVDINANSTVKAGTSEGAATLWPSEGGSSEPSDLNDLNNYKYLKIEPKAPEDITFGYAYDAWREPAFPSETGDTITLNNFGYPLDSNGNRGTRNEGTWTLVKTGTYSFIKNNNLNTGNLDSIVQKVFDKYKSSNPSLKQDAIVIHELKDGQTHIAYGIVIAYNATEGYAVFIGNNWNSEGSGYLLSTNVVTAASLNITARTIATDFVQNISISLEHEGETFPFTSQTPEEVTITNTGNVATGELTVSLSGEGAAGFTLKKNSDISNTINISSIAKDSYDTFTVAPKADLPAGTYTATVTVSGPNIVSKAFIVSFNVNAPSNPGGSYTPTIQKPTIIADEGSETTLSIYGDKLTIKVADDYELADVIVNGVSKGKVTELTGLKTGDKVEIKTEKKQEEPAGPTKEEIIAALDSSKLVARSKLITLKNGKKAVRVTWYDKNGKEVDFDGVEIYRSIQRYKGYGLKPFYATKDGKTEGYYVNTKDLKEGTTYYYKVRGYVEIDGQKYYTDYSLKAIRTIK